MKTHKVCANLPRLAVITLLVSLFTLVGFVATVAAQGNREEEQLRGKVSEALTKGDTSAAYSMLSNTLKKSSGLAAASGSVFFEQITGCGFYPQETRLQCVIDIKQNGGYGGQIESFGSTEHVYFCVDWNGNGTFDPTESVGQGSVVMHDGSAKSSYAVYRDINIPGGFRTASQQGMALTTTRAPILSAQAILSWVMPPTGCNFSPVWGNVFNFRIRLDPIR
jgi:hypothetical protein